MNGLSRFLGGSPVAVIVQLAIVSLLVGWFLSWVDFTPEEVWFWVRDLAIGIWERMGAFADYMIVGALIVVPVFLVMRLLAARGPRG